ncbi:MAG: zinc-ribbon domain-containing protein [Planctomycetes bacterium]|nr:zinc-ribbon domain-containing protein [Planctomycetota bacterium]
MLIACPFCKTEAQISEELEGSKVKCPKCQKTYQAHEKLQGRDRTMTPWRIVLAAAVIPIVGGTLLYMRNKTESVATNTPAANAATRPASNEAPTASSTGGATRATEAAAAPKWNTAALDAVRDLFAAVYGGDVTRTAAALAGDDARERAKQLVQSDDALGFSKWKPGELRILSQDDTTSKVEGPLLSRVQPGDVCRAEFTLTQVGGRWKVAEWKLDDAPADAASASAPRPRVASAQDAKSAAAEALKVDVAPRRLEHLASTDAATRTKIDALFARMVNLSLSPTENVQASNELVELGKPALPVLLNGILETRITGVESMSQVVLINQTLQAITDHPTVFAPGPDPGKVEELRLKTVKSWFEWWGYSGERFQTRPKLPDPFDAELEKDKKKR